MIAVAIAATAGGGDERTRTSTAAATEPPPSKGHGHQSNIYLVDVRTKNLRQVTQGQIAQHPSWTPNERIAFAAADCDDECWSQLFYVDSRARNQVLVAGRPTLHLFHPSWSPDGRRIAVVANGRGILSMATRTGKTRHLTKGPSDEAPEWSPRSDWVLFDRRVRDANYDIYAVNAVTRKVRRITRDVRQQTSPTWSPDGSRIAFAEQQEDGKGGIFAMRLDGSDKRRVTGGGISAQEPAWSPDGKRIAFVKQSLDKAVVAIVGVEGGRARPITTTRYFASKPAWSPDGRRIAFAGQPTEKE